MLALICFSDTLYLLRHSKTFFLFRFHAPGSHPKLLMKCRIRIYWHFTVFAHHVGSLKLKLQYRGFARQQCCMVGTTDSFSYGKTFSFLCKIFSLFLPCNMAAVQNLYTTTENFKKVIKKCGVNLMAQI